MGRIIKTTQVVTKEAPLPDGNYLGTWGGNVIEVKIGDKSYQLTTEEGVRGIGYKVVVIATYEEINN